MDIKELKHTKAMIDKDHLTHMLDMLFRVDILQRDLVIIKTHTVVVVGRKERLIFLYYSDRNIGIKTVNLILHAIVKTQPSTRLNLRPTKSQILGSTQFLEYNTIQPPTHNKEFRQISDCSDTKIKEPNKQKIKNQKIRKSKN